MHTCLAYKVVFGSSIYCGKDWDKVCSKMVDSPVSKPHNSYKVRYARDYIKYTLQSDNVFRSPCLSRLCVYVCEGVGYRVWGLFVLFVTIPVCVFRSPCPCPCVCVRGLGPRYGGCLCCLCQVLLIILHVLQGMQARCQASSRRRGD